jgi:glycogen synthase
VRSRRSTKSDDGLSIIVFTKFHPSTGGIETLAEVLAREWAVAGHRVTIVTDVAAEPQNSTSFPFTVLHRPHRSDVIRAVRQADIIVHNNISLKAIWPLALVRRPFVAAHHSTYFPLQGRQPWRERLKQWLACHAAHSISVSEAVKRRVGCGGAVIPNLYDHERFVDLGRQRNKDLVFVGRLVSDKGVNVLLNALGELQRAGQRPTLTIVGDGPERANIEHQLQQLDLTSQVELLGWRNQDQVCRILNEHRIMVVPSVWDEPFGIVALEGAACGCVIVGSSGGGLPEAIGPCGVTFPNNDHRQLAAVLGDLLRNPERLELFRRVAPAHLAGHRADRIAQRYVENFRQVLGGIAK